MDSSKSFRFCHVCLGFEDSGENQPKLRSLFEKNGKYAKIIYDLSGIIVTDVYKKFPALICDGCLKEISQADLLRRRIFDANKQIVSMTVEKEIDLFKSELKELKGSFFEPREVKKKPKKINIQLKMLEENMLKILENSSNFYVPQVYLNRKKKSENKIQKNHSQEENVDSILEKLMTITDVEMKNPLDKVENKKKAKTSGSEAILDVNKKPKIQVENSVLPSSSRSNIEKNERSQENFEMDKFMIREIQKTPTKKKKPATTYKCDSCSEFYYSFRELDNHKLIHQYEIQGGNFPKKLEIFTAPSSSNNNDESVIMLDDSCIEIF